MEEKHLFEKADPENKSLLRRTQRILLVESILIDSVDDGGLGLSKFLPKKRRKLFFL
jgi:hypothetical protein